MATRSNLSWNFFWSVGLKSTWRVRELSCMKDSSIFVEGGQLTTRPDLFTIEWPGPERWWYGRHRGFGHPKRVLHDPVRGNLGDSGVYVVFAIPLEDCRVVSERSRLDYPQRPTGRTRDRGNNLLHAARFCSRAALLERRIRRRPPTADEQGHGHCRLCGRYSDRGEGSFNGSGV